MRIETYPIVSKVKLGDKWIGTQQGTELTKNFSVDEVIEFINLTSAVDSQTLRYKFQFVQPNQVREKGTISFNPNQGMTVSLNANLQFMLSDYSLKYLAQGGNPVDISSFYTQLIDSRVFISNTKDISKFGVYLWSNAVPNIAQNEFHDITLTHLASQGDLKAGEEYFISLLSWNPTQTGGDKTFVFTQGIPQPVWVITHNLNKYPSVSVVDSFYEQVYGKVDYIDKNKLTVTFTAAFSGRAFCN